MLWKRPKGYKPGLPVPIGDVFEITLLEIWEDPTHENEVVWELETEVISRENAVLVIQGMPS